MSRALFLHAARDARVSPYNLREGWPAETLLDVAAVGICGSDLHYYKDGGIGTATIESHSFPGTSSEVGWPRISRIAGWRAARSSPSTPTMLAAAASIAGRTENLCPNVEFIGAPPHHGAMTERIWVNRELIVPVPQSFSPADVVMLEPLGVAIHAVDLAKPRLLEPVTVLGCGPIGLLILQVLKVAGAGPILAVDPLPHRRTLASRLGAAAVAPHLDEIVERTERLGTSLVVEATNSPNGFRDAVRAARIGGRIVLVGIPDGDLCSLPAAEARRRGLTVKFSRRMGHVYPRAIQLVEKEQVDVRALITDEVTLDEARRRHFDGSPRTSPAGSRQSSTPPPSKKVLDTLRITS